tara:strand:- start:1308 stop:1742 length:435 start_codon:yes stop_codon:yes gene_type:complete
MTEFVDHDVDLVIFPELVHNFCQWIFAAPANSPILKAIIDESVTRILNTHEFKGPNIIHHTTGPCMFTKTIEAYLKTKGVIWYDVKEDYARKLPPNRHIFVYPREYVDGVLTSHLFAGRWDDGWTRKCTFEKAGYDGGCLWTLI